MTRSILNLGYTRSKNLTALSILGGKSFSGFKKCTNFIYCVSSFSDMYMIALFITCEAHPFVRNISGLAFSSDASSSRDERKLSVVERQQFENFSDIPIPSTIR
mmetsp:Transcript_19524/g.27505  ORF Transcript_19524/g.27505 Transcript_19524/m.27505 type:complete len:104 (-) Transcript_19524:242-553(-)